MTTPPETTQIYHDPPPCAVCHEIHQGERYGWYANQDTVLHDYDLIINTDRANQAKARSAAMTATVYASVAGSQYGSQYAGSVADPRDLETYRSKGTNRRSPPFSQQDYQGSSQRRGSRRTTEKDQHTTPGGIQQPAIRAIRPSDATAPIW